MTTVLVPLIPILSILSGAPPDAPAPAEPHVAGRGEGQELLARAASDMEKIHRALREVLSRVQDARDEKDLVKLLCADERLSRLKVLVTVAERADVALAEAITNRDAGAPVESSKIAIARGKVDALRAEAAGCIGQLAFDVGEKTALVVEEAQMLPDTRAEKAAASPTTATDPYRTEFGIPSDARR